MLFFVNLFRLQLVDFLKNKLLEREINHSLRELKYNVAPIDFASNDYLGYARSVSLKTKYISNLTINEQPLGSTGSRLLCGNNEFVESLETVVANYHHAEAGLIFNSGYDANVGLLACIANKGDTIITDELIHASLIDGARLSYANRFTFKHNDLDHLRSKLKNSAGEIFVVTESVFSMDGDIAPLIEIVNLCEEFGAHLIVDEAHATGVFGNQGKGLVCELGIENKVFARIHTFGKALGAHGAIILGSSVLRSYLINFARTFIYTTALPYHSLLLVKLAYEELANDVNRIQLIKRIAFFKEQSSALSSLFIPSNSAIQSLLISGNKNCKKIAAQLQRDGYDVRPILSPTVPIGKERIRICLHTHNSFKDIEDLLAIIQKNLK